MSQGPLCPNLTKKVQKEVSQMANRKLSCAMLYRWFKCKLKPPKNDCLITVEKHVLVNFPPFSTHLFLLCKVNVLFLLCAKLTDYFFTLQKEQIAFYLCNMNRSFLHYRK